MQLQAVWILHFPSYQPQRVKIPITLVTITLITIAITQCITIMVNQIVFQQHTCLPPPQNIIILRTSRQEDDIIIIVVAEVIISIEEAVLIGAGEDQDILLIINHLQSTKTTLVLGVQVNYKIDIQDISTLTR